MKKLSKNERFSLYGNLKIQTISKKSEENICIAFKNKRVCIIGDYLYDFLDREYKKFDYDWMDRKKKIKTTKVVIDNEILNPNSLVNVSGYVQDKRGISWGYGKKYNFKMQKIPLEDLFSELENLYDDYICEFDTIKSGLKIRIEEIEFIS